MTAFPEYETFDATGLAGLIASGEISAKEVVTAAIDRIELRNPSLNAVITKVYESALDTAGSGISSGPLAGVPFLVKDLFAEMEGVLQTNGSRVTRAFKPGFTATIVKRFEGSGLIPLGRTNVPEFGLAPVTEPELHGVCRNPWDLNRTPGGSSGGSAAAVAAGMVPVAHASDGGGSIRIPASQTGLFGMKPTRARTPSGPVEAEGWFGFSIGHVVTRSVRDSAAILDAISGPEPGDPYAVVPPDRPFLQEVGEDPGRLRIGIIDGAIFDAELDPECRAAVASSADILTELGHEVEGIRLPINAEELTWAFTTLVAAATSETVRATCELVGKDRPDPEDFELVTWVLSLVGHHVSAADFARAMVVARNAGRTLGRVMETTDVLVSSTLAKPPLEHGELRPNAIEERLLRAVKRVPARPLLLTVFRQLAGKVLEPIPNTPLFNITGQPAMSVPLHWTKGNLPVGVQFATRFGDEATLFRLAGQLEDARPWFERRPSGF